MSGRFVVLEGGDGTGKSTQVHRLTDRLRAAGIPVRATFEPGATPAGAVLRSLLLHGEEPVGPLAESLLMAADRAQHVDEVVVPALESGTWVVSDRFVASSLVYQGIVRDLGVDVVEAVNAPAVARATPDLVVVLDLAEGTWGRGRERAPTDRLEREGPTFHAAVRAAYRELAAERGWPVVDASPPVDDVTDAIWAHVEPLLAG